MVIDGSGRGGGGGGGCQVLGNDDVVDVSGSCIQVYIVIQLCCIRSSRNSTEAVI